MWGAGVFECAYSVCMYVHGHLEARGQGRVPSSGTLRHIFIIIIIIIIITITIIIITYT